MHVAITYSQCSAEDIASDLSINIILQLIQLPVFMNEKTTLIKYKHNIT